MKSQVYKNSTNSFQPVNKTNIFLMIVTFLYSRGKKNINKANYKKAFSNA